MANNQFKSTTDFKLRSVIIFPTGRSDGLEIKKLVNTFSYVESVVSPFVAGTMSIVDSGGLLNTLPIKGGEVVQISILTSSSDEPVDYILHVWKIGNRYSKNQTQSYTLGLVSVEALNNEYLRIQRPLEGNMSDVVEDILTNDLKTTKDINKESTLFDAKMIATNKRPFDLISSLAVKGVPRTSSSSTAGQNRSGRQSVTGTAGYFFWESKKGYNFYSVDTLLSGRGAEREPWGEYKEKIANVSDGKDDRFIIIDAMFRSELDLLSSMRKGKYSSLMVFFNHSTGRYQEYHYNINETYDSMEHLGSQGRPDVPTTSDGTKKISDYPTRVMTFFQDHETWYNGTGPASFEPKDGATQPSQFCDYSLRYAAQSAMRYELLKNQVATIVIPGNSNICAGDTINIKLINKLPNVDQNSEPYDPESSGLYLIEEVTHTYDTTVSTNGKFITTLRLMRDSYGDIESNHGR